MKIKLIPILFVFIMINSTIFQVAASSTSVENHNENIKKQNALISINGEIPLHNTHLAEVKEGIAYVDIQFFRNSDIQAYIYENAKYSYGINSVFEVRSILNHHNGSIFLLVGSDTFSFTYDDESENEIIKNIKWDNGSPYYDDENEIIMVPLRKVAETLDISVRWDDATKSVNLITDERFRSFLDLKDVWEEHIGYDILKQSDPSGKVITNEELLEYFESEDINALAFLLIDKYTALVVSLDEFEGKEEIYSRSVHRLKNNKLSSFSGVSSEIVNDEPIAKRINQQYYYAGILPGANEFDFTHIVVEYSENFETKTMKFDMKDERGIIFKLPSETRAMVYFYSDDILFYRGYVY